MPNWAYTSMRASGNKEDVEELKRFLDSDWTQNSDIETSFGDRWLGYLCASLGKDPEDVDGARGTMEDYTEIEQQDDGRWSLDMYTETAWAQPFGVMELLEERFGVSILYFVEESGMALYATNDVDRKYIKYDYIIDDWSENDLSGEYMDAQEVEETLAEVGIQWDGESSKLENDGEGIYIYKITRGDE